MKTNIPPVQSVSDVLQTPPQVPPKPSNAVPWIIIGTLAVILLIAASVLAGFYLASRTNPIKPLSGRAQTTPGTLTPTETPYVQIVTIEPTVNVPTEKPVEFPKNTDGNTFTSGRIGIGFHFATTMPDDAKATLHTLEIGSKAYVYVSNMKPETGQSIEMFEKTPSDTLAQAIQKKFLTGIPSTDCFVRITVDPKAPANIVKATIAYPVPSDSNDPAFTFGDKCPANYSESNGMAYFLLDTKYPDRFYYLSIGQYMIPAYDHTSDRGWQDTVTVLPKQ